jgi:Ca2+-binding RTX toxin-like protein
MPIVSDYTALLNGVPSQAWNGYPSAGKPVFVTYSFETSVPGNFTAAEKLAFRPYGDTDKAFTEAALTKWSLASGVTFLEVPSGQGDMRFIVTKMIANAGESYAPTISQGAGGAGLVRGIVDVKFNAGITADLFGLDYMAYLHAHEIGHALGFKHPFDPGNVLSLEFDTLTNTLMSYPENLDPTRVPRGAPLGPIDIAAVQFLYGTQPVVPEWNLLAHVLTQTGGDDTNVLLGVATGDIISGGGGNDMLAGFSGEDLLLGEDGDDVLHGGEGIDVLTGGDGNDVLFGGGGSDTLAGGNGNDTYHIEDINDAVNEVVSGGTRDTVIAYGLAAFRLPENVENLELIGTADMRSIGNGGDNIIIGSAGADRIYGENGADIIKGDVGNDVIIGGNGRDEMTGGRGRDVFDFDSIGHSGMHAQRDVILDFVVRQDRIDLSTIDASTRFSGNQAFKFIGASGFHKVAGELRAKQYDPIGASTDRTIVEGDINGDGKRDFQIELGGFFDLHSRDFIL